MDNISIFGIQSSFKENHNSAHRILHWYMVKDEKGSLHSYFINKADMHLSSPPPVLLAQATVVYQNGWTVLYWNIKLKCCLQANCQSEVPRTVPLQNSLSLLTMYLNMD